MTVFHYDKRGVGQPSKLVDPAAFAQSTKEVSIEDAALAYARMIANPLVDAGRSAVLGHSDSTWFAPYLVYRYPEIQALALIGTGLGPVDVLRFSQVTLPLLGLALFDTDGDGVLDLSEIPTDPASLTRFQRAIRPAGQIYLFRYTGSGATLRPVGFNPKLDTNGDGKLDLEREIRPVYDAFFRNLHRPLSVIEQYADPSVLPTVRPLFEPQEQLDGPRYASFLREASDQNARALLGLPSRPSLLIVNGEHDDQTPASSAEALAGTLTAAGYAPALRINRA